MALRFQKMLYNRRMFEIVLIRHGESTWNKLGLYAGWTDVGLTQLGLEQARAAGAALAATGRRFDIAFCSLLSRSERTLSIVLEELGQPDLRFERDWRLNERHYGAMQGLCKIKSAELFGLEKARASAVDYFETPPPLPPGDPRCSSLDPRYAHLPRSAIPSSESLYMAGLRVSAFWDEVASPLLRSGSRVLVSAHGNVLRALVKKLEGIPDDQVAGLEIPNGLPFAYELDGSLSVVSRCFLPLD